MAEAVFINRVHCILLRGNIFLKQRVDRARNRIRHENISCTEVIMKCCARYGCVRVSSSPLYTILFVVQQLLRVIFIPTSRLRYGIVIINK